MRRGVCSARQVARHLGFEQRHKGCVHEGVVVGDVEADQPLAVQAFAKPTLQLRPVRLLHDEDHIGPSHEFVGERRLRIMVRPRRLDLQIDTAGDACSAVGLRRRFWLQMKRTR